MTAGCHLNLKCDLVKRNFVTKNTFSTLNECLDYFQICTVYSQSRKLPAGSYSIKISQTVPEL